MNVTSEQVRAALRLAICAHVDSASRPRSVAVMVQVTLVRVLIISQAMTVNTPSFHALAQRAVSVCLVIAYFMHFIMSTGDR